MMGQMDGINESEKIFGDEDMESSLVCCNLHRGPNLLQTTKLEWSLVQLRIKGKMKEAYLCSISFYMVGESA